MLIIGLTGGIGSGKSEAAKLFSNLGAPVIDTDTIAHKLTEPGSPTLQKIISQFGDSYLLDNNELDRKLLSKTIFNDVEKKIMLERILHPDIKESVKLEISRLTDTPYLIIVVPLLFETSFQDIVHRTLVVDSSEDDQISRTQKRDGKNVSEIKQIIQQQLSRQERLNYADDILDNSGTLKELNAAVKSLHSRYMSTNDV